MSKFSSIKSITPEVIKEISMEMKIPLPVIEERYVDLVLYCESTGRKYKNYKAALLVWLRKDIKEGRIKVRKSIFDSAREEGVELL